MQRFIDAEKIDLKLFPFQCADGEIYVSVDDVRRAIARTPTEDVVPKSEVEGLQAQIEHLTAEKERLNNFIQDLMKG